MEITVNTQSSIQFIGNHKIYFDPLDISGDPHDADAVFITHSHYDHLSPADIQKVAAGDTIVILPRSCVKDAQGISGIDKAKIIGVQPGEKTTVLGYPVEVIAAYNTLKPFHPKHNKWCGYVITIDGRRYYVAGDTDKTKDTEAVKCDVALIPIGGTYTMNPKEAAALVNVIRPSVAIPTHYGSIAGKPEDGRTFEKLVDEEIKVEMKL